MTDRELIQMSLKELEKLCNTFSYPPDSLYDTINALRARLAQPEPTYQPMHPELRKMYEDYFDAAFEKLVPSQREWQSLTEGETIDLALSAFELPEVSSETREKIHRDLVIAMNDQDSRLMLFAANIEAKLKEKNK